MVQLLGLLSAFLAGCATPAQAPSAGSPKQTPQPARRDVRSDLILVRLAKPSQRCDAQCSAHICAALQVPADAVQRVVECTAAIRAVRRARPDDELESGGAQAASYNNLLVEGSGAIIDKSGLILTNDHVVRDADSLHVWIAGRGWIPARIHATDPLNDLAIVAVDAKLPGAVRIGSSDALTTGEPVIAVGYTPGTDPSSGPATLRGRLTSLRESLQTALDPTHSHYYGNLIEATVPLLPGHSGGPLVNAAGQLVGVSTAAVVCPSENRRTGYAIPMSPHVRAIVDQLVRGRNVQHGYIGVVVRTGASSPSGAWVDHVIAESPAAAAGLQEGDLVVAVNGQPVESGQDLAELVHQTGAGRTLRLDARRAGSRIDLSVRVKGR